MTYACAVIRVRSAVAGEYSRSTPPVVSACIVSRAARSRFLASPRRTTNLPKPIGAPPCGDLRCRSITHSLTGLQSRWASLPARARRMCPMRHRRQPQSRARCRATSTAVGSRRRSTTLASSSPGIKCMVRPLLGPSQGEAPLCRKDCACSARCLCAHIRTLTATSVHAHGTGPALLLDETSSIVVEPQVGGCASAAANAWRAQARPHPAQARARARTNTQLCTHTHARTHAHTHTHTHTRTHAPTHACAHTHTRTHAHIDALRI